MRNNLVQNIRQRFSSQSESPAEMRERILQVFTAVIIIIGSLMLVFNARQFIDNGNWLFLITGSISFVYLLIISFFSSRIPYSVRAVSVSVVAYLFALLSFENYGLPGDGRVWLLFFSTFTTISLGLRAGLIANVFSLVSYTGIGYLIINEIVQVRAPLGIPYSSDIQSWIRAGITFTFISFLLSISTGILIRWLERNQTRLENTLTESQLLSEKLEEEQRQLALRSQNIEKRAKQIRAAAEISSKMGAILNPQELLNEVASLVQTNFDLYYVGVFLLDEHRRYAILKAGTGDAGRQMMQNNHQLTVGGASMVGWATTHGQARISLDVDQETVRYKNPYLPLTRSELAIPLMIGNQILGAMTIQSIEPSAFDEEDIFILQNIADGLAISLENANLFQQFESSLKEIQQLNRQYMTDSWSKIWLDEEQELSLETGATTLEDMDEINIPLTLRGEQVIGNITLTTEQEDFSTDDKEFIEAISTQAALALESARLLDEANKRVEQERALRNLTTEFAKSLDFDTLLQTVVQELGELPMVKEASIHVAKPDQTATTQNNPAMDEE